MSRTTNDEETTRARVVPFCLSVATVGTTAERERGSSTAAKRPDFTQAWPSEMALLSVMRNLLDAKREFEAEIVRATTVNELLQIAQMARNVAKQFESVDCAALFKAERV